MSHSKAATRRFPLNAFSRGARTARREAERKVRASLVEFRARLVSAQGMDDLRDPLLGEFVDYRACMAGFEAMWRIAERHNGWATEAVSECMAHADVKVALANLGLLPVSLQNLVLAFKSPEFEAYRSDSEYLRCIAAEKRAHELLPQVIADTIVREQRYMEGFRRSAALNERMERATRQRLEENGQVVDVDEFSAYLESEFAERYGDDERDDEGQNR